MISVEVLTKNPYYYLKDANLITIGKRARQEYKEDYNSYTKQYDYFKKCFLAEHSTIEILQFRIFDNSCRGDVTNQIVRHTKGHPRYSVQSSRPDWNNNEPRKPSDKTYRFFMSTWNPLAFMQACRQRLCANAQKETREWTKDVIACMQNSKDPMLVALADCCVPQCEYRGGYCFEIKGCGRCPKNCL